MINTRFLIPALGFTLALTAEANSFTPTGGNFADGTMKGRQATNGLTFKAANKVKSDRPHRTLGFGGAAIDNVEDFGTLRLVLEEDFSLMSQGSIEQPARDVDLALPDLPQDDPNYIYPWWNLKPEYTHEPHWGTGYMEPGIACPAGGCYYMEMVEQEGPMGTSSTQAKINTPILKVDEDGAIGVLEFRARTLNEGETYDYLYVEVGETNNMGPSWRVVDEPIVVTGIPGEWTTYRLIFRECGPTTLFHFVGMGPGNVYLDDIKVYQLVPKVMYPQVLPHSDYKGTSFTANWTAVEGADSYLLSVYSLDETNKKVDLLVDQPVNDTHYEVTGTISGQTYYYTVKAVKGSDCSLESFPQRVYDLVAPVMNPANIIDGQTYTASWGEVPGADVYNYMALDKRVADTDGPFVVTFEDFTGITDFDGYKTGLTKEDPSEESIAGYFYPKELNQQGWHGESSMPYDDYMAFDAFFYTTGQGQSGFLSPEFDMSKDNGKFTVQADLAAETDWAGNTTSCVVGLFNWDDELGDYRQDELVYVDKNLNIDWQSCVFNFTKGSERSIIGIFAISSFGNLYLDNLKITQNYKAGDYLIEPFRFAYWHGRHEEDNPTEIKVDIPGHAQGFDIFHKVSAYSHIPDPYGYSYDSRESAYSDVEFVMTSISGIENVATDAAAVAPEYFTINGIRLSGAPTSEGIYIVRQGGKVSKTIVK